MGDRSDNFRVIAKKVDPTHSSVAINKQDIIAMTRNGEGTRGTRNITMKKIKRCGRGDAIHTRVRRLMIFFLTLKL